MKKLFAFFAGIVILLWFIATAPFAQAISFFISLKDASHEHSSGQSALPLASHHS